MGRFHTTGRYLRLGLAVALHAQLCTRQFVLSIAISQGSRTRQQSPSSEEFIEAPLRLNTCRTRADAD